jgi:hypothetical protein
MPPLMNWHTVMRMAWTVTPVTTNRSGGRPVPGGPLSSCPFPQIPAAQNPSADPLGQTRKNCYKPDIITAG